MVLEDKRVTVKEMSVKLGIGETSVCRILKELGEKCLCKVKFGDVDRSHNLDGQHCHTRLIALMWQPLITISLVN
jgi:DNA-binding transcriptional regulator GbsR (MarR family)